MNNSYAIVIEQTDQIVDVVDNLAVAIGVWNKWKQNNPNYDFEMRPATIYEQSNAHNYQKIAMKNFVFPE
jgi:hypothetical protein